MPTFYLVRHGAKEKVMGDPPLSELGREQAKITGNVLKQHAINSIFSSPLLRAKQTAEIIGEKINLPVAMDQRLVERMNWGDRKKETFEEFWEEWERSSRDRKYQPKHGDSSWATGERLRQFLLEERHTGNILVVTHGGAIGDFLLNIFSDLPLVSSPTGATYVKLIECSITTVKREKGEFLLERVGDISHLPEPVL